MISFARHLFYGHICGLNIIFNVNIRNTHTYVTTPFQPLPVLDKSICLAQVVKNALENNQGLVFFFFFIRCNSLTLYSHAILSGC